LAKNGVKYDDKAALDVVDELFEHIQYYCIKASVKLAKELGACEWFHRTKYAKGILPIDTYTKEVDKLVSRSLSLDWEALRKDVLKYGMRNSTLTAIMPCESSSVVTNSTNGIEPVRALVTSKKSKQGILKMVVPEIGRLKNKYTMAFDMENNSSLTNIQAVIQKYIDQGISANHYYNINKNKKNLGYSEKLNLWYPDFILVVYRY
jgi:ribonucleoside-diphosphate reductase alpha chain